MQRDLALFFVYATVYFGVNSAAVNLAVAVSTGRVFRDVWSLNTRGIIAYDLGASVIAMLVAFAYAIAEYLTGFGPYGLFVVVGPVIVVRHIYGLYHQLQDSGQELLQVMVKAI